jgi:CheY-like chemotaxis protein
VLSILVVDDDEVIRHALARMLGRDGHRVTLARDAEDAHVLASGQDLGVLDIHLGSSDGIDLAGELLAARQVRSVVFFSSERDPSVLARAAPHGPIVHDVVGLRAFVRCHRP